LNSNDESTQRSQRSHVTGQWEFTPGYPQNAFLHFFVILLPFLSTVLKLNLLSSQKLEGTELGDVEGSEDRLVLGVSVVDGNDDGSVLGLPLDIGDGL